MDVKLIYKSHPSSTNLPKAIAFDLDETLGSFSDFYSIWARLDTHMKTQQVFNGIMDLYPEFLRVGILSILRYIRCKQESGHCLPIYIYTNNQCEDVNWIYRLIDYLEGLVLSFEDKSSLDNPRTPTLVASLIRSGVLAHSTVNGEPPAKIFARPIFAFKIGERRIEPGRTTHEKTYSDFVRCSMLSTSHELCFVDDVYYKKMKHKRVFYIQPPPYVHSVPYREVLRRFLESDIYRRLYPDRNMNLLSVGDYTCNIAEEQEERKITNKIMYHIREFFLVGTRKNSTKRRKPKLGNFTRRK
jgi:hypothetical protein